MRRGRFVRAADPCKIPKFNPKQDLSKIMKTHKIIALLALGCAGFLQAQLTIDGNGVINNVVATASSEYDSLHLAANLTNNSGISTAYDIAATHASHPSAENMWHGADGDITSSVVFDLRGAANLLGIYIWNGIQNDDQSTLDRGVRDFRLSFSADGITYGAVSNYTLTQSVSLIKPLTGSNSAQFFDLSAQSGKRYVKLEVISTFYDSNEYAVLSEVMFTGTAAPEPAPPFIVTITPNADNPNPGYYDFSWESKSNKVYSLVSSSDLSTPISSWEVWDGLTGLTSPTTNVYGGGNTKRFFAVVENDP